MNCGCCLWLCCTLLLLVRKILYRCPEPPTHCTSNRDFSDLWNHKLLHIIITQTSKPFFSFFWWCIYKPLCVPQLSDINLLLMCFFFFFFSLTQQYRREHNCSASWCWPRPSSSFSMAWSFLSMYPHIFPSSLFPPLWRKSQIQTHWRIPTA